MTDRCREYTSLSDAVRSLFGESISITGQRSVSGGDINRAYVLSLSDGSVVFAKTNLASCLDNFRAEAVSLEALAASGAVKTPKVLALGSDPDRGEAFLMLEFLKSSSPSSVYWEKLGHDLAALHRAAPAGQDAYGFGFFRDNYIGTTPQKNTWHDDWISFFRDCRLERQMKMAGGLLDKNDRSLAAYLLDHLGEYLTEPSHPSLLHGDLWSGNFMTGPDGTAWLIDPASYYGHPEADIAMTELFGGFDYAFYDAYREEGLITDGYADRRDIYNLYQLLNHLNLFGGAYLGAVRRILKKYGN